MKVVYTLEVSDVAHSDAERVALDDEIRTLAARLRRVARSASPLGPPRRGWATLLRIEEER